MKFPKMDVGKLVKDGTKVVTAVAPIVGEHIKNKREEKSFFEKNKNWIFLIILSIFIVRLDYIVMFENLIIDSIINIIYGIIVLILLCLFFQEEKDIFKIDSNFVKFLVISLTILGVINSLSHIGYAIITLVA